MISSITIKGFKRFSKETLKMAPMTVLTGLNGSGKTSLIQALLILAEASRLNSSCVSLNGPFGLELGSADSVLNWNSENPIEIGILSDEEPSLWCLSVPEEDALYLDLTFSPSKAPEVLSFKPRMFTYLCAERIGPRGFSASSSFPATEIEVGTKGEFCAHLLSELGDKNIEAKERRHPKSKEKKPRLLKYEVEQWLSEIARPIEVTGERLKGALTADLKFRLPGSVSWVKSTNMGFGLTYSLPIVLAGLTAAANGILIVENPEAHLHPAGQSRMGMFLAWLAGKGIQVVIETHSDHLINGIRRAIAECSYLLPSAVILHWFGEELESNAMKVSSLEVSSDGSLSNWPAGFFDQYQIDTASLGRLRRNRLR